MELQALLHTIFLRSPTNLFDEFLVEVQKWYERPAHTLTEMRSRNNKKVRGDIFEEFCALYLKYVKGYDQVWLLSEVPDEILIELKIKRQDMGIDIVVSHAGESYAVQCKYKKHGTRTKNVLSWTALSTFYAMCLRTGPWSKYIVMTNCDYTRHQGPKTTKDISICLKTLQNLKKEEWIKMCDLSGNVMSTVKPSSELSPQELRERRLARFECPPEPSCPAPAATSDA